jgi:integrase
MEEEIKAPGLKWIKRRAGSTPYWIADEADVANGFTPKSVNLSHLRGDPYILIAQCNAYQAEMLLWRAGHRRDPLAYDGTVRAVLGIYQRHEQSSYHALKPSSRVPYDFYLAAVEGHIGKRQVRDVTGLDVKRWHGVWSSEGEHLAAASMSLAVLEAALRFGKIARLEGCALLLEIIRETRRDLPKPKSRTATLSAEDVIAARAAAHRAGRPSRALAYAMVYESVLRLWDVIGQWVPIDGSGISDVIDAERGKKWFGLQWEDIGEDMVVRYVPSKTSGSTGVEIVYPLAKAPMVLEEFAHWPADRRKGPMIIEEGRGLPYDNVEFSKRWNADARLAGIKPGIWARDLRASAVTEGRARGASTDDTRKVAGHTSERTTGIYDRAVLEAAERFADARIRGRIKGAAEE